MLTDILKAFEDIIYVEKFSSIEGLLQKIDPRVKLCLLAMLIVVAISLTTISALLILALIIILLAILSKLPLRYFLLRVTIFIPLFAGIIVLPLPFITPGTPLNITLFGYYLGITSEGILKAALFTLRVWVCVATLNLLVHTTRFSVIIQALKAFKIPEVFLMMTTITYRFIFIFIEETYRMVLAREARLTRKESRLQSIKSLAKIVTTLFIRAFERGEKVYLAMLARGYTGKAKRLRTIQLKKYDWVVTLFIVLVCIITILFEYLKICGV